MFLALGPSQKLIYSKSKFEQTWHRYYANFVNQYLKSSIPGTLILI